MKKHVQKNFNNSKSFTKKNHFDTNGIMTLTEIPCMHDYYRSNKKNHCIIFYQLLQLSTTGIKNRINTSGKRPKYVGTAHTLKPLCITFKIVQGGVAVAGLLATYTKYYLMFRVSKENATSEHARKLLKR